MLIYKNTFFVLNWFQEVDIFLHYVCLLCLSCYETAFISDCPCSLHCSRVYQSHVFHCLHKTERFLSILIYAGVQCCLRYSSKRQAVIAYGWFNTRSYMCRLQCTVYSINNITKYSLNKIHIK